MHDRALPQALRGNSVYYNYSMSNNGVAEKHKDDYEHDYFLDVVKNRTVAFINKALSPAAGGGGGAGQRRPLFAVMALPAVHEPADPAPQHAEYGTLFFCSVCALARSRPCMPSWDL